MQQQKDTCFLSLKYLSDFVNEFGASYVQFSRLDPREANLLLLKKHGHFSTKYLSRCPQATS